MGQPLEAVLQCVVNNIKSIDAIAGHDVHADVKILIDEAVAVNSTKLIQLFMNSSLLCTKLLTASMLRIKMPETVNAIGWKWPSLRESYAFVTNGLAYDEHNPMADVMACVHILQNIIHT